MFENLKKTFNMGKTVLDSTQQFAQNVNNIAQGPGLFGLAGTPQQTNEIAQQNYPYQEKHLTHRQPLPLYKLRSLLPSNRWKRTFDKKQRLMLVGFVPCCVKRV